jgi:hypothetical protein
MHNVMLVQFPEQSSSGTKVLDIGWSADLHRLTLEVGTIKRIAVSSHESRYAGNSIKHRQHTGFPGQQSPRNPAQRECCITSISSNDQSRWRIHERRPPEYVFFQ